jgi:hypothetical protein
MYHAARIIFGPRPGKELLPMHREYVDLEAGWFIFLEASLDEYAKVILSTASTPNA